MKDMVEPMDNFFNELAASEAFAEEYFVASIQSKLNEMLEEKGLNRSDLAERLGVSKGRVSQIFSDDCKNFTVRLLARAFIALDEKPALLTEREMFAMKASTDGVHKKSHEWALSGHSPSETKGEVQLDVVRDIVKTVFAEHEARTLQEDPPAKRQALQSSARAWSSHGSNVVHLKTGGLNG